LNFRDPRPPNFRDLPHDLRFQQIVRIKENYDFPAALLKPEYMGAQLMGFRPKISRYSAAETLYDASGAIGRGVVYNDYLFVGPIDCEGALDGGADEVAVVIIRYDNR
jgi:hypothetical protein